MMGPRLGARQRPLELFAAQLGVLGATPTPTDSTLAFLYPGLLDEQKPRRRVTQRSTNSDPVASSSSLLPTTRAASSGGSEDPVTTLPDIYAPGSDGLWRKTSGVAETCSMQPTSVSSEPTTVLDGQTSAASLEEFDTSTLPDGWKLQEPLARSSLILIICLSVAVACAFVVLVLSLVSWRRRIRQDLDIERRRRKAKDIPPDDSFVVAAATQRKWLRAGMRWKENVRLSARRRRSARVASASNDSVGSLRLSDISRSRLSSSTVNLTSSASSSRPSSPSRHPQSSTSSISLHPSSTIPSVSEELLQHPPSPSNAPSPSPTPRPPSTTPPAPPHPPLSPPPPPPHSAHPPAYHTDERAPHYARDDGAPEPGPSKPRVPTTPRAHDPSIREQVWPPDEDEYEHGTIPEVQTGHVATDDKALLAARAARASAPAPMHTRASISARAVAPELDDEMEMAEFASRRRSLGIGGGMGDLDVDIGEDVEASPSYVRIEPAFPEPPRRLTERASEKMRGEYAYAYGRGEGEGWAASAPPPDEGEVVGSAPPELELGPSAYPAPSAPPGEDDFEHLPLPSAPPKLDDEPAHVPLPPSPIDPRSPP